MLDFETITPARFSSLLKRHPRLALSGVVKSGKSLLTDLETPDRLVLHTDELQGHQWEDIPDVVLQTLAAEKEFLLVGTQVPRVLRHGLKVDALIWLNAPLETLTPRQQAFGRGIRKIMHHWRRENPKIPVYFALARIKREEKNAQTPA